MQRKILLAVMGVLGVALIIWAAAFAEPYELHGSEIISDLSAPPIPLTRADGSSFAMEAMRGRIVLLFFGYTSCPDYCPTTMADMKQLKEELGEKGDQLAVLLVTVDPMRDTPERIQAYASGFDETFIGLSGTETELEPVWQGYGVYREISSSHHDAAYSVDHSTRLYLIDKSNRLRVTYAYGTPVSDLAEDVRFLLREN